MSAAAVKTVGTDPYIAAGFPVIAYLEALLGHGGVAGVQDVTVQVRKRARGMFYGWWIVAAGSVIQALQGGFLFHGFTAYVVFLERDFGWSRTVLSGAYSLTRVESAFLGPLQGWLIDRFGPKCVTLIGLTVFGLGFILFSRVNSMAAFYFAFLLVAIGSSLGGMLAINSSLVNWFRRQRAMAMGITMSGMAVGGLVLVPVLAWSMMTFGWRDTALASGVAIWLLGIPSALFLRHRPGDYGYLTDGDSPSLDEAGSEVGSLEESDGASLSPAEFNFSAREAMRTPAFWLLGMGHGSALLAVSAVSVHLIPHIVDQVEMSVGGAAGIVSLLMGILIVGQLGGGYIGDRVSKRLIIIGCMLGHAVGLWFLAFATSMPHLILFALFHGSAWGIRGPLTHSIRADYFGPGAYATIMGFSSILMMIGMTVGPLMAGAMADYFGDYRTAFVVVGGLTGLGSLFFVFAREPTPPAPHVSA